MPYDIDCRIVFDYYHKNAEIMPTIRLVDYSDFQDKEKNKLIYGGNFIVCQATSYDDACIKLQQLQTDMLDYIERYKQNKDLPALIKSFKLAVQQYKRATE